MRSISSTPIRSVSDSARNADDRLTPIVCVSCPRPGTAKTTLSAGRSHMWVPIARGRERRSARHLPKNPAGMNSRPYEAFRRLSHSVAHNVGRPWAFGVALALVIVWGVTGPLFGYSDTWQLTINTGTTIITFLMVFIIQHTQHQDSEPAQLKADEMMR